MMSLDPILKQPIKHSQLGFDQHDPDIGGSLPGDQVLMDLLKNGEDLEDLSTGPRRYLTWSVLSVKEQRIIKKR